MTSDVKLPGIRAREPWYEKQSDLTDEEKLDVLQIILEAQLKSGDEEAIAMIREWERTLSDRVAEKALLNDLV